MIIFIKNTSWSVFAVFQHLSPSTHLPQHLFTSSHLYSTRACTRFIWQQMREKRRDGGRQSAREEDGKRKMAFGPFVEREEQMWEGDGEENTDYCCLQ